MLRSLLQFCHPYSKQEVHAQQQLLRDRNGHLGGVALGVAPAVECSADALLEWDACACSKLAPGMLSDGVDAAESEPRSAVKELPSGACIRINLLNGCENGNT